MVTKNSIIKAIDQKIKTQFPDIDIQEIDEEEGLIRPSFRTGASKKTSNFMGNTQETVMTVRVYYFPSTRERYYDELSDMEDALDQLFLMDNTLITDDGFMVQLWELDFDTVDGVLHCYFDLNFAEDYEIEDETENMEDINIDII